MQQQLLKLMLLEEFQELVCQLPDKGRGECIEVLDESQVLTLLKITNQEDIKINLYAWIHYSDLILDGGKFIQCGSRAIITEKVLRANHDNNKNKDQNRKELVETILRQLMLDEVILIPSQPYDWTGHADGMVRFVDERRLLVNDFSKESPSWKAKLARSLRGHGLEIITFPYVSTEEKNQYGEYTARGCYINFLQIGNLIVLPQFDLPEDARAIEVTRQYFPSCTIETINCNEIAFEGGVLNCISWGILL